jgi:hypothetical protein
MSDQLRVSARKYILQRSGVRPGEHLLSSIRECDETLFDQASGVNFFASRLSTATARRSIILDDLGLEQL